MNIIEAFTDPKLFQPWFSGPSWTAWHAVLKAGFAIPMTSAERKVFRKLTCRPPPKKQVRELWVIAGRRAGKDSIASLIAAYAASLFDPRGQLRPGERAVCMCLARDRDQAKIVLGYIRSFFTDIPFLAQMVVRDTVNGLELSNGVDIVVATNDYRAVRGRSISLAIFDEVAFWNDDRSAIPDHETYSAIMPGMATLKDAMLIGISSPHRKAGLLYDRWREHFGKAGDDVLVIHAPSLALNPMLDRKLIDAELARDPIKGRAEWLAEWRDDITTFIDRAMLEAAVDEGVVVRPREQGIRYVAFADPSGGAGDAFTLAIAHCTKDKAAVLDCLIEHPAPFNPVPVTESLVQTLAQYGLNECYGDHYAAGWVVGSFAARGVSYYNCPRDRSALYANVLPLFTSGAVRLLDNKKLVGQFAALERRPTTTRDKIDHPPAAHDDLCNAAAGALVLAAERSQEPALVSPIIVSAPRTHFGDANYTGGAGLAPHLDMYKRDWPAW